MMHRRQATSSQRSIALPSRVSPTARTRATLRHSVLRPPLCLKLPTRVPPSSRLSLRRLRAPKLALLSRPSLRGASLSKPRGSRLPLPSAPTATLRSRWATRCSQTALLLTTSTRATSARPRRHPLLCLSSLLRISSTTTPVRTALAQVALWISTTTTSSTWAMKSSRWKRWAVRRWRGTTSRSGLRRFGSRATLVGEMGAFVHHDYLEDFVWSGMVQVYVEQPCCKE